MAEPQLYRLRDVQVELEPGRWWRVLNPDGTVWCETADETEARAALIGRDPAHPTWHHPGRRRLERLWQAKHEEWRPA